MTASRHERITDLFCEACELPPGERTAFLESACGGDVELREQVRRLLEEDAADSSPIDRPIDVALGQLLGQGAEPEPAAYETGEGATLGRYELRGELARGGVGVVLRGFDPSLGRDVALKILREEMLRDGGHVERFLEEARVGGRLQHPGIVPVYELGRDAAERPFFTMKLVEGRTLAGLLAERDGANRELGRFLSLFESVCQTMAYAHDRGVIHRDLKPSNIMVGAFGEVLVVDWGLSKVLGEGERPFEPPAAGARSRADSGGGSSIPGSAMGTPAYMPPEQARGELESIDMRSDVFALGAILCELLTGRPPYPRGSIEAAREADLTDCLGRLAAAEADGELVALARRCLAPRREDRPADAGELARSLRDYLDASEARAQAATLAAAEARIKVKEERRARRLTVVLAATVVLVLLLTGGGWWWIERGARQRAQLAGGAVRDILVEAAEHRGQGNYTRALETAERARPLLEAGDVPRAERVSVERLMEAVRAQAEEQRAALARAAAEAALVAELEDVRLTAERVQIDGSSVLSGEARLRAGEGFEQSIAREVDRGFGRALGDFGIEVDALAEEEVVRRIQVTEVASEIGVLLDAWAAALRGLGEVERADRVTRIAQACDPDPLRAALRDALRRGDDDALIALIETSGEGGGGLPTSTVLLAVGRLRSAGRHEEATALLRNAVTRNRGDFLLRIVLTRVLTVRTEIPEARVNAEAALALRPESFIAAVNLAVTLIETDRPQARRLFERIQESEPGSALISLYRGLMLHGDGDHEGAAALFRQALAIDPSSLTCKLFLALCTADQGRMNEGLELAREAYEEDPGRYHLPPLVLGHLLFKADRPKEALRYFLEADRRGAGGIYILERIAECSLRLGDVATALEQYRKGTRLAPREARPWHSLGVFLFQGGGVTEGHDALVRAAGLVSRDSPDAALFLYDAALADSYVGNFLGAASGYRAALLVDPAYFPAANNLSWMLSSCPDRSLREPQEAVRLALRALEDCPEDDPRRGSIVGTLGAAYLRVGRLQESRSRLEEFLELEGGENAHAAYLLAMTHAALGERDEAEAYYYLGTEWEAVTPAGHDLPAFRAEAGEALGITD